MEGNNKQKLLCRCPKGHEWCISYNTFKSGVRCGFCAKTRKLDISFVKKALEKAGFILLFKEYKNNSSKIEVSCSKGHIFKTSWNNIQSGGGCVLCNKKYNFSEVSEALTLRGYTVISENFEEGQRIKCLCCNGHMWAPRVYEVIGRGYGCPVCAGNSRKDIFEVGKKLNNAGYTVVNGHYDNCESILLVECPAGHRYKTTWHKFNSGYRCSICSNNFKKSIEYVRGSMQKEGYTLLTKEYTNNKAFLKCVCPVGHKWQVRWDCFQRGDRCFKCFRNGKSKQEDSIVDCIVNKYPGLDVERYNKTILGGKELDIFIPVKNLAIEYCGLYWHSELCNRGTWYHRDKVVRANNKGIRLVTVFSDFYIANKKEVLERLFFLIENPKGLIFTVSGNYLFSDLCWDLFDSIDRYKKMGYKLFVEHNHRTHYFKKNKELLIPGFSLEDYKKIGALRFWDCGHRIFSKDI